MTCGSGRKLLAECNHHTIPAVVISDVVPYSYRLLISCANVGLLYYDDTSIARIDFTKLPDYDDASVLSITKTAAWRCRIIGKEMAKEMAKMKATFSIGRFRSYALRVSFDCIRNDMSPAIFR